ncbi:M36 family metallopeptidase [Aequorivita nionensis]|uniref:M36 family metallopeptidase n=1 Tax=Aequorivita nionensis TaxID=1287690 RepID=UPI0039659D1A
MKKSKLLLMLFCMLTLQLSAQHKNPEKEKQAAQQATKPSTASLEKLIAQKSNAYVVTNENVSKKSGIRHVYLRQAINGLEVYGTESSVHFDKTGKVLTEHNKFLADVQATLKNSVQGIDARAAIAAVANQMGYKISNLQEIKSIGGKNKAAVFNKADISLVDIPVKLMYYYREGIGTQLVWELSIAEKTSTDWWNFRVDAVTGKIIDKENWTVSCNIMDGHNEHFHGEEAVAIPTMIGPLNEKEATKKYNKTSKNIVSEVAPALVGGYRVYAMPTESPNHGPRTLQNNPDNATASPFGWHDTNGVAGPEFTVTTGNNVDAHKGSDRPNGTAALIFDFAIDLNQNPALNTAPYITNLFYWNNIVHDVLYQYGFDEVSGNFQENNYGNGGAGSDSVNANAQASGNCNANFGTPADGSNPTMNMFLCNNSTPSHDGDLDAGVIVHEYGHGVSNRLTGGPSNVGCLNNQEQMGEGWSDIYGLILTIEPGDTGTDARGVGTYLLGQPITGNGVRTQRYSTDFAVNNHTYNDIITAVAPHGVGEVWATMLWDMTWGIIGTDGFDPDVYNGTAGNNVALSLITEGLKLQPCSPGFVDGRDAIIAADQALYGGAHICTIWEAFARRGLGYSANQGSSGSKTDGTEAFDLPPTFSGLDTIDEVCLSDGIQTGLSGGNPNGGVYSGAGVTDDGNGMTFTFDPTVGGPGLVTVTYTVNDFCTGTPTAITDDINVTNDPPEIVCMGSGNIPMTGSQSSSPGTAIPDNNPTGVTVTMNVTENVSITDLDVNLNISHTWVGDLIVTIKSPAGTTATIVDRPGRTTTGAGCSGNDILATLDDEAATPVENVCAASVPTINGSFTPNNPLSIFDGESTLGLWELTVSDNAGADTGTINSWGIDYDYEITAPVLDVTLDSSGNATVNAEDLLYSVSVDCGGYTVLAGSPLAATVSFNCSDTGLNTVPVEVTNDSGATATCSAIVNVIGGGGGGPSSIICPSDISQDNDLGVCEAAVTVPQPTVTNGCSGSESALNFDGVNDQVDMPLPTVFDDIANNDITIEVWVNPQTAVFSRILFAQKTASNFISLSYSGSGQIFFYINNTIGVNTNTSIPLNTWTHVAARWNATTQTADVFFNGVIQVTLNGGSSTTGTDNKMTIGSRTNSAQFFPGTLDEIRIWDILRSDMEIFTDFNSCVSETASGLVAYYKLDDNTGSTIVSDSTVNGYDGTLVNMDPATDWVNGQVSCNSYTLVNDYNNSSDASGTYPVGTTTVLWSLLDGSGNTIDSCSMDITINDNEAPVANCAAPFTVQLDANGMASITAADVDNGSADNCAVASTSIDVTDFTCADVGPNTVTLTVTDVNGNSSTCTTVVTVEDNVAPTAVCQNITVFLDATGNVSIAAADVDGGSADACGIATTSIDITDFTCADLGPNNVTLTVTDVNGNTSTCIAVVTVEDDIPPTIACPADITVNNDAGMCGAIVNFPVAVGFDNCSVTVSQTGGLASGSAFPVGVSTVEFTATDGSGNTEVCSFTITVVDNEAPTMVCQNITIQLDEFGNASIIAADVDGGSIDNCGIASLSVSPSTFDCSDVGDNPVVLTVTDIHGNSNTCTAIVTVEDVTPPLAVCQNITVELDPVTGTITITGADLDGGSTDACGIDTYTLDIDTFDCSNVGENTVVLTVTDVNGNISTCTAIVTVEDNTNPELVCQDFTLELGADGTATLDPNDVIASNTDNCGIGTIAVDITEFSCADIGAPITVQVFASDVNGNLSTCTAVVTVVDLLAPEITCPANQTVDPGAGNLFYILPDYFATGEATAIDNCTDPVTILSQAPVAGTPLSDGVYTITLTAEDEYGNISTCTFELTVMTVLGADDHNADLGSVQMYPNPAKHTVMIGNPASLSLENLRIFDIRGRMVKTIDLRNMGAEKAIDVSEMASATYLVVIQSENGEITKRLIKE